MNTLVKVVLVKTGYNASRVKIGVMKTALMEEHLRDSTVTFVANYDNETYTTSYAVGPWLRLIVLPIYSQTASFLNIRLFSFIGGRFVSAI